MNKGLVLTALLLIFLGLNAFSQNTQTISGAVTTSQFELVPNVQIEIKTNDEIFKTQTDAEGKFSINIPDTPVFSINLSGKNIKPQTKEISAEDKLSDLYFKIKYTVPPVAEVVTITGETLTPNIETRNKSVF
jgi:hypothetical protein